MFRSAPSQYPPMKHFWICHQNIELAHFDCLLDSIIFKWSIISGKDDLISPQFQIPNSIHLDNVIFPALFDVALALALTLGF